MMKKTIFTIAILAAFATAAHAQSNVTLYGVADSYVDFSNNGQSSASRVQSGGVSGSRLGFKGTEDLGGGMKALFVLENGFNIDDGSAGQGGLLFGRQASVGLSGNFGNVSLGRQYSPLFWTLVTYSLGGGIGWGNAVTNFMDSSVNRVSNSVTYESNNLSGFKIRAMYALGESSTPGQSTVGNISGANVQYNLDKLSASISYLTRNTSVSNKDEWTSLGTLYDFGVATAAFLYQRRRDDANLTQNDYFEIGATIPLAGSSLLIDYGKFNNKLLTNADASVLSIRYDYYLSKRTTLYAGISKMRNEANAHFGIGGSTGLPLAVANGNDPRSLIAGMRLVF